MPGTMKGIRDTVVNKVVFISPAFASEPRWSKERERKRPVEAELLQCEICYGRDGGEGRSQIRLLARN